jgi:uncharacterized protein (DUF433 family)
MNKPEYFHLHFHNLNLSGNSPEQGGNLAGAVPTTRNVTMAGDLASGYTQIEQEPHWAEPGWRTLIKSASVRSFRLEQWFSECVQWGDKALQNAVEIDPKRRGGIPVLKGTRFTVGQTLAELADSAGVPEVANRFDLNEETIRELLYGLALLAERPRT